VPRLGCVGDAARLSASLEGRVVEGLVGGHEGVEAHGDRATRSEIGSDLGLRKPAPPWA
jgi:hypothetical protein